MSEVTTLPKIALELLVYTLYEIEEMNKTAPDNDGRKDGYDTLTLDPNGKVFDKVV
tara:strand:- start:354 stop:521 length:168 start_codon:yes stop_codon:yes gene_type:complete